MEEEDKNAQKITVEKPDGIIREGQDSNIQ